MAKQQLLRTFLTCSVVLFARVHCAFFEGSCFSESELYGFSRRTVQPEEWSDARTLYQRRMVESDSKPVAFRICSEEKGQLQSVQIRLQTRKKDTKDWLNIIGDQNYYVFNDCELYSTPDPSYVAIFISLGYKSNQGVNYISIVFAPNYDNTDSRKEVKLEMGKTSSRMEFVNLAFSESNAFMGFHGVSSKVGSPINKLGVVYFSCLDPVEDQPTTDTSGDQTVSEEEQARIDEQERRDNQDQAEIDAAVDENKKWDDIFSGGSGGGGRRDEQGRDTEEETAPIVREDQKDQHTLIIFCVLVAFVTIVAIATGIILYMRGARKVEKHANIPKLQGDGAADSLPPRIHESQAVQLNPRRGQRCEDIEGLQNAIVEPMPMQAVSGVQQNRFEALRQRAGANQQDQQYIRSDRDRDRDRPRQNRAREDRSPRQRHNNQQRRDQQPLREGDLLQRLEEFKQIAQLRPPSAVREEDVLSELGVQPQDRM